MGAPQPLNVAADAEGMPPIASNLVLNLHIQFKSIGQYQLHLMLDGVEVKRIPLKVVLAPSLALQIPEAEEVANG